jgi:hypothetical protein
VNGGVARSGAAEVEQVGGSGGAVKVIRESSDGEPDRFEPLPEFALQEIVEPGAYVELESGRLYRVAAEDLTGDHPLPITPGDPPARYVRISRNPFVISMRARQICWSHGIAVNF